METDPPTNKEERARKLLAKAEERRLLASEAIHIEDDFRKLATTYNSVSGTVVASLQRRSDEVFERKLFYRQCTERAYHPVEPAGETPSLLRDELICSPTHPVIYYKVHRAKRVSRGFSSDWLSVDRFDLRKRSSESMIKAETFQLPDSYPSALRIPKPLKGGGICELFSISGDDSELFCSCRFERFVETEGALWATETDFWVCSIELSSGRVTLLTRLERIWF